MDHRQTKLNELRRRIEAAEYDIDPTAVAEAIMRHGLTEAAPPQVEPRGLSRRFRRVRARVGCQARRASGRGARTLIA